jgi:SAM-dependent methyltransferase
MREKIRKIVRSITWLRKLSDFRITILHYYQIHTDKQEKIAIYEQEWKEFVEQTAISKDSRFELSVKHRQMQLYDKTADMGFDAHYVYHTAWAMRIVKQINPSQHIDISSYIFFSAMLSAFIPTKFYDFRPAEIFLDNLISEGADVTNLPFATNSVPSLSCMHVVEHIGLGRYGDPIQPLGDKKAMQELQRVLAPNGNLLFVTPIGRARVMFNAHRVYSYEQIIEGFAGLELVQYDLIPDEPKNGMIRNPLPEISNQQAYGCGCFWFRKKA